jgi:hypothetical protein
VGIETDCFDPVPRIQRTAISAFTVSGLEALHMISAVNNLEQGCQPLLCDEQIGEVC